MKELILNTDENKSNSFSNHWSETQHYISTLQRADENNNANENISDSDSDCGHNDLPKPQTLNNIHPPLDHTLRSSKSESRSFRDFIQEKQHGTCQNCINYKDYRHLGCTNNASYGLESSSSETEFCPSTAEVDIQLELELLSLVAEFSQDRLEEGQHCHKCCQGTSSRDTAFWNVRDDPATNNQMNCCCKHSRGGSSTFRKQAHFNNDNRSGLNGLSDTAMVSQEATTCPDFRNARVPDVNIDVEQKHDILFAGENANGSSHVTHYSATALDIVHPFRHELFHHVYRERTDNYIPAKYRERENVATAREDTEIPLCPTIENYWETAASEPITNPFLYASNDNDEFWQRRCETTCRCNNLTCCYSVRCPNTSCLCGAHQVKSYLDHTQAQHEEIGSGINADVNICCGEVRSSLGRHCHDHKRKINQNGTSLKTQMNSGLALAHNRTDKGLLNKWDVRENELLNTRYKSQVCGIVAEDKSSQRPDSIHLSVNQQKGNECVHRHLLDTSKHRRKQHEDIKSQLNQSFSKTFPTGNFNEITQQSNESLAVIPNDGQGNSYHKRPASFKRIKRTEHKRPTLVAVVKKTSFCQIKSPDSRSFSPCVYANSTDNKNKEKVELACPSWYTRMQSFMQRTGNPLQFMNDKNKRSRYQRLKHSRTCRRRRGINGVACCNRCLPELHLDAQTSFIDKTIEKRNSNYKKSKIGRSKYSTHKSRRRSLMCKRRRTTNTSVSKSGRRSKYSTQRRKFRKSTSTGCGRRRTSFSVRRHRSRKPRFANVLRHVMKTSSKRKARRRHISKHRTSKL